MDVEETPAAPSTPAATDLLDVIENAVESVLSVDDAPIEEHAERYQAVHSQLQDALSDTDLRDSG